MEDDATETTSRRCCSNGALPAVFMLRSRIISPCVVALILSSCIRLTSAIMVLTISSFAAVRVKSLVLQLIRRGADLDRLRNSKAQFGFEISMEDHIRGEASAMLRHS